MCKCAIIVYLIFYKEMYIKSFKFCIAQTKPQENHITELNNMFAKIDDKRQVSSKEL